MGIKTGQQAGPGRTAAAGVIELGKAEAILGKAVNVWGFNLTAIAAQI